MARELKSIHHQYAIITMGSDSHQEDHLGAYIEDTKKQLKALGFTQYCTYNKMIPEFHNL